MADATTTYDVVTRYMVQNHGSAAIGQMTSQVHGFERASASAGSMFARIGAAAVGYFGIQQANRSLIGYNSTMEQSRIQMAGLMAQAGSGDFVGNLDKASLLMRQMRDDSAKTVGTTQDYVAMASMLIQPLTMAGGKLEDIREMTRLSVVAARAMGIEADVAARDVDQAIRGQYKAVDPFSGKLLTPLGYGGEEGRKKFNALPMRKRMEELQRAQKSPAIEAMAQAQETTFEGVASTFESLVKETLGKLGMPIFKGLTAELTKWNAWLQKNEKSVGEIADIVGKKLLQAAVSFKNAIQFAAEHWKSIAATFGALKAAGYLAGLGGAAASAGAIGMGAGGAAGAAGAAGAMSIGGKIAATMLVVSAVYVGAQELSQYILNSWEKGSLKTIAVESVWGNFEKARTSNTGIDRLQEQLVKEGFANESGFDKDAFAEAMKSADMAVRGKWSESLGMHRPGDSTWKESQLDPVLMAEKMATAFARMLKDEMRTSQMATGDSLPYFYSMKAPEVPKPEKPKINVNINRIEVASDDPDRFAFGMVSAFRDAAKNPSGVGYAIRALRDG